MKHIFALITALLFVVGYQVQVAQAQCGDISPQNCPQVVVDLPYKLNFTGNEGGITSSNASSNGTGFPMILSHTTARNAADLPSHYPTNTTVKGYEPSKLNINNGILEIIANKGLAQGGSNNQVNALGVGLQVQSSDFVIQTTLQNTSIPAASAQAGLWYGLDDKNLVRLAVLNTKNNSGTPATSTIEFRIENNDTQGTTFTADNFGVIDNVTIQLRLLVSNSGGTKTVRGFYKIGTNAEVEMPGSFTHSFANGITLADGVTQNVSFAGIYASYRNAGNTFTAKFDQFEVKYPQDVLVSPTTVNQSVSQGGASTFTQNFTTSNSTTPTISLTASEGGSVPTWLKAGGQVLNGTVTHHLTTPNLDFTLDATGLAVGTYQATVTAVTANYNPVVFTVEMEVQPANMAFTPNTSNFTIQQGATPTAQAVNLSGVGSPTLTLTSAANWIVLPASPAFGNFNINVDAGGFAPGTYQATVVAKATGYADAVLTVNLTVTAVPLPTVNSWTHRINFQPATSDLTLLPPFMKDVGYPYGAKTFNSNTYYYGWLGYYSDQGTDISDLFSLRSTGLAPGVGFELRSLARMMSARREAKWEMALPNGVYYVKVNAGDYPDSNADNHHIINVEGIKALDYNQNGTAGSAEGMVMVEVKDERLTIDGMGGIGTKINSVYIKLVDGTTDNVAPVVSLGFEGVEQSSAAYRNQVIITVNASDLGGSGIATRQYSLNGGTYQDYNTGILAEAPGTYTIRAKVTDGNGNQSITPLHTFSVVSYALSHAKLVIENTAKFPSNEDYIFSFINGRPAQGLEGPNYDYPNNENYNHDANVVRIHNHGLAPLQITALNLSDAINYKITKIDNVRIGTGSGEVSLASVLPIVVAQGTYRDITLIMNTRDLTLADPDEAVVFHGQLEIESNDDINPIKVVNLHSIYQQEIENGSEPTVQQIIEGAGFKTITGFATSNNQHGYPIADEVYSPYLVRADASKPVYVRQISAHHGCCNNTEAIHWQPKSTGANNQVFRHYGKDGQTLLPRKDNLGLAEGTFNPAEPFSIRIAGDNTDPNRNGYQGTDANGNKYRGCRIWKAINWKGEIIPNAYIISHDYLGGSSNFDYNDNTYYIENIRPEVGTAFTSALASGDGINGSPTEKQSNVEWSSTAITTTTSKTLHLRSLGQIYANGTADPQIIISQVQIIGANLSEFSAAMPVSPALDPAEATTLQVTFQPQTAGIKNATLLIHYNSDASPMRIPLYGLATSDCYNLTLSKRIKAGGGSAGVVINGKTWETDLSYRNGNTVALNTADVTSEIAFTDEDALYRSYLSANGDNANIGLNVPLANGKYLLRLHFAENQFNQIGKRVQSIYLEGQLATANYDIWQKVGYKAAVAQDFEVYVTDAVLNLELRPNIYRPAVSGVEIYSIATTSAMTLTASQITGANCGSNSGTITLQINNATQPIVYKIGKFGTYQSSNVFTSLAAGNYTIFAKENITNGCEIEAQFTVPELNNNISFTVTTTNVSCGATADGTATVSNIAGGIAPYTIQWSTVPTQTTATATGLPLGNFTTVTITDATGCKKTQAVAILPTLTCPIRLNAGGSTHTTADGRVFIADNYFNAGNISTTNNDITGTTEDILYKSNRWYNGNLTYTVPVVNGNYQVVLHFSESYFNTTNARRFNIDIEGTRVLTNFDIYANAGGRDIAITRTFNTTVSDGTLNLVFGKGANDNPKVSAIEIIYTGGGGNNAPSVATPTADLTASRGIPFSMTVSDYTFIDVDAGDQLTLSATLSNGNPLPTWLNFNPITKTLSGTPADADLGAITIALKATDVAGASVIDEFNITVILQAGSNVSFVQSVVNNLNVNNPTALQFGPDGRLYVMEMSGNIKVFTLQRNAPDNYSVTATENIPLVQQIPNYNDDGTPNTGLNNRQALGMIVAGTATAPVIYATSNDPRTGGGNGDLNLDTNSGIVSKITKNGGVWEKIDLIRGLPKSEHNHATNGLAWDKNTNTLYIAQGGHANKGAPSHELAWLPEYAYSAAVLSANLNFIESLPTQGTGNNKFKYDLPTLLNTTTPFGGQDGLNQARLVQGGPVQVYSPGFRNAYDVVLTEAGRLYSWDNSSNAGWGLPPIMRNDGRATNVDPRDFDNNVNGLQSTHYKIDDNYTYFDSFHHINQKGYFAGNSNPTRANPALPENKFGGLSPVPDGFDWGFAHGTNTAVGVENAFKHPGRPGITAQNASLFGVMGSTNGLCEYRASNFGNQMKGNVLGASFNGYLYRVAIDPLTGNLNSAVNHNGSGINGVLHLASGFGTWNILDVCAQGDADIFPGTIWIAEYGRDRITILEPQDFNQCNYSNPSSNLTADYDSDGYTNGDELDNSSDPCSPASRPSDWDADKLSDLNDSDDDNDGILDINDAYALDKDNGTKTTIPVIYEWEASSPNAGYILNSGFSGLMINNASNYRNQYDADKMTVIGTAGFFTIDELTTGTAELTANNQEYGFQMGVNTGAYPGKFQVHTAVIEPFGNVSIGDLTNQTFGVFIGTGNQKNYFKLVADANEGAGGLRVVYENNDIIQHNTLYPELILGKQTVHLYLIIEPSTRKVQPAYSIDEGAIINLGSPITVPNSWLNNVAAVGIISARGTGESISATWGFMRVEPIVSSSTALFTINSGNNLESASSADNSFKIVNNSPDGQKITKVVFDLSTAVFPDLVFDPNNAIADLATAKAFTANTGSAATGFTTANYLQAHGGNVANGYNQLEINFTDFAQGETFEFSIDTDPTSIRGISANHSAGSISGLELAGATVTVVFDDGSGHVTQLYRKGTELGASENIANQTTPSAPSISIIGITTLPTEVTNPSQTVRVNGLPNAEVKLLVLEGGLFVNGVPAGGYDIDAYEANRLLNIAQETTVVLNAEGKADVSILLTKTDNADALHVGINHIVAITRSSNGQYSTLSNVLKMKMKSGPPVASYRVNAAGGAYTTVEGAAFTADAHVSGGSTFNVGGQQILNTEDDVLYQTERYGNFTYNFPVANGNYQVVLHFAEIYFGIDGRAGVGARVFDVKIENNTVLDNYDIMATAGATLTAQQENFYVAVADGQLTVQFINVVNNAKISVIEIIPFNGNTPPYLVNALLDKVVPLDVPLNNPFNIIIPDNTFGDLQDVTFTYSATLENGQPLPDWISFDAATRTFTGNGSQYQVNPNHIMVKVIAADAQGLTATDVFKITILDPIEIATIRINAAGAQYTAIDGRLFSADAYFTNGSTYTNAGLAVENTDDDVLYRSERWGASTYNIPVSNGGYKVLLHFAEIYFGAPGGGGGGVGSRRFHVDIEGGRKLTNYDVFAKAGGAAKAITETFYVDVTDGSLNIQLVNVTDNAKISAIEVSPFVPIIRLQQNTNQVLAGLSNRNVLRIEIPSAGTSQTLQAISFNTSGTTNVNDISKAKLYFTGINPMFLNGTQIGTDINNPNGAFSFTGLNQALTTGSNYAWLVFDINSNAAAGNVVDAICQEVTLSGGSYNPEGTSNPVGSRLIVNTEKNPSKMLDLDGANDYVELPNETQYDFTNQMTVEAWIKVDQFNKNWQAIVTKGDNSWRLHRNNNTNFINFAINTSAGGSGVTSTTNVNDGQWHHLAGVYTGTQLRLYVDGVLEAQTNIALNINNSDHPVRIGENAQATNRYFDGKIDEVRIWNLARTQKQIRESMHLVLRGNESGLVSYHQFNEGAGTTTYDMVSESWATMQGGMASSWIDGTVPLGDGKVYSTNALLGLVTFLNTGLDISFGTVNPVGELVVTRIDNLLPPVVDPATGENKSPSYWVINNYGNKIGLSPMTVRFYLPQGFLLDPNPNAYKLYKRASNSNAAWTENYTASAVDVDLDYVEFTGLTGFSQAVIAGSGVGLPVQLVSFEGKRINDSQAELTWQTASEENNTGFEIEKSTDNAQTFTKIGFTEGAGNATGLRSYKFLDKEAYTSAYYRLKQIDADGKLTFSQLIYVAESATSDLMVYPNPVNLNDTEKDRVSFNLSGSLKSADRGSVEVTQPNGMIVWQKTNTLADLEQQINKQLPNWASGVYILKFRVNAASYTIRLVKE
jgi:hypothetical protein